MHVFRFIFFCTIYLSFYNTARAQAKVSAVVTGFKNDKGICRACIFNNPTSFNGEGAPLQCLQTSITKGVTTIVFENLPRGNYAISLFHDENRNNKMDKNFMGIPKEGYGASNNKLPMTSAPTFKDNQFAVNSNAVSLPAIKLRYIF